MPLIRDHLDHIRKVKDGLTQEFPYLMSLEDPLRELVGGSVAQANRETAARCIVNKTHRLATEKEITAYLEREAEKRHTTRTEALRAQGIVTMRLPPADPKAQRKG